MPDSQTALAPSREALTDDWALRDLTIVVRAGEALRPYARELVESLRG